MTDKVLSRDAVIFGLAYLNGPKRKLSFGGEGAKKAITDRARAALDELLAAGYAKKLPAQDGIRDREHYMGALVEVTLGQIAKARGDIDPLTLNRDFVCFAEIEDGPELA